MDRKEFEKYVENSITNFAMMDCPYCNFSHKQNLETGKLFANTGKGVCGGALKEGFNLVHCHNCKKPFVALLAIGIAAENNLNMRLTGIKSMKIEGVGEDDFPEFIGE